MKRVLVAWSLVLWSCADDDDGMTFGVLDGGDEAMSAEAGSAPPSEEAGVASACEVPSNEGELLAYLRAGRYLSYARESAPYQSTGPHFGLVRTYLDPTLARSLEEGRLQHPRCSAAIKELLDPRAQLRGWAVFVKTAEERPDGSHVVWLETTSTSPGVRPAFYGAGLRLCANCHASGRDFVRIDYPLR